VSAPPVDLATITWGARLQVASHGVVLALRTDDPGLLPRLARRLPHDAVPVEGRRVARRFSVVTRDDPPAPLLELYVGRRRVARWRDPERLGHVLAARARLAVAELAPDRVFVHAGVVALDRRAILVPGRTHTGKTTLVAELVRRGAEYYSDEYAVVDREGWVHPYAKPLGVRGVPGAPATGVTVAELGGCAGQAPIRVGTVLATEFQPRAHWEPAPLSPGLATLRLFDNAVAARSRFAEVHRTLATALLPEVQAWHGPRGEAADVATWLLDRVGLHG
jgi:hypothetical protein